MLTGCPLDARNSTIARRPDVERWSTRFRQISTSSCTSSFCRCLWVTSTPNEPPSLERGAAVAGVAPIVEVSSRTRLGPSCNGTQSHYSVQSMMSSSANETLRRTGRLAGKTLAAALLGVGLFAAIGAQGSSASGASPGVINAVGAENEYANVLGQIGGRYVKVSSILNNPNTDPHTFEASTSVAREVSDAQLIVQNGVGYDSFMNDIESASPNSSRKVIV